MRWSLPFLLVVLTALTVSTACSEPAATEPAVDHAPVAPLPTVTDDATTLLFTYMNERGLTKTASKPADVPKSVRERVYVVDLGKSPEERQAHRFAFFADLTKKNADGTYPVLAVSRYNGAKGPASALAPVPDGAVLLYSAEWCGYCKKAKAWFEKENIAFIERDVEKTAGAQQELTKKLKEANMRAGGVPVIDVAGTLVIGFDKPRLASLIEKMPTRN